jgi:hypothetical protein
MKVLQWVGVFGLLALLTGCAVRDELPDDPHTRIAQLKKITQAAEERAIGLLPKSLVTETEQLPTGSFLNCSHGYQWSGGVRVKLKDGADADDVQRDFATAAARHGFEVNQDKVLTGRTRYELVDDQGVQLLVTLHAEKTLINVTSASPCVTLPDDFQPPASF